MTVPRRFHPYDLGRVQPLTLRKELMAWSQHMEWETDQITKAINALLAVSQIGQATVSGAATTAVFTMPVTEPNASYQVVVTPVSSTGTPAAGSNRVLSVAKTATTVTVTMEAAPGVGNTQVLDIALLRNPLA